MKYKPKAHRISGRLKFMRADDSFQCPKGKLRPVRVSKYSKAKKAKDRSEALSNGGGEQ
jgi:hypothetical protein